MIKLSALPVLVSSLLLYGCTTNTGVQETVSVEVVKSSSSWNGQPLPAYPEGTPEVTILRITIPPGTTLPMHTHPVINAGVLLSGELHVFTEAGDTLQLNAGDPIVEVVDTWHTGTNTGTEPAEIMVFYAGVADSPLTLVKPEPCSEEWTSYVEQEAGIIDDQGHGPDPGSAEWKSAVEFRLGVRGNPDVPARDADTWCEYIDEALSHH